MRTYNVQIYKPNRAFHFNLNQVLITQLNINKYKQTSWKCTAIMNRRDRKCTAIYSHTDFYRIADHYVYFA